MTEHLRDLYLHDSIDAEIRRQMRAYEPPITALGGLERDVQSRLANVAEFSRQIEGSPLADPTLFESPAAKADLHHSVAGFAEALPEVTSSLADSEWLPLRDEISSGLEQLTQAEDVRLALGHLAAVDCERLGSFSATALPELEMLRSLRPAYDATFQAVLRTADWQQIQMVTGESQRIQRDAEEVLAAYSLIDTSPDAVHAAAIGLLPELELAAHGRLVAGLGGGYRPNAIPRDRPRKDAKKEKAAKSWESAQERQLFETLSVLDPSLAERLKAAKAALWAQHPEAFCHYSATLRRLVKFLLRQVAPDDEVRRFTEEPEHFQEKRVGGRPNLRGKFSLVLSKAGRLDLEPFLVTNTKAVLRFHDQLNKGVHAEEISLEKPVLRDVEARADSYLLLLATVAQQAIS